MKMYRNNLFNGNARELSDNAFSHAANNCMFFDRDLAGSNDHGFARPEESDGLSDATGDLIR